MINKMEYNEPKTYSNNSAFDIYKRYINEDNLNILYLLFDNGYDVSNIPEIYTEKLQEYIYDKTKYIKSV